MIFNSFDRPGSLARQIFLAGFFPVFCLLFSVGIFAQDTETQIVEGLLESLDTTEVPTQFTAKGVENQRVTGYTHREVVDRLNELQACMPLVVNSSVGGYLNTYLYRKATKTRTMLGKRLVYFPIFEQKLKEHGMPADLKYLSVVESALDPKAVSRVGATGLWQFMPATGSEFGLKQNGQIDERSDPVQSTEAAMQYLKKLHNQFGDWALALAAYNSGPTRVSNAIKRAHSRNFWRIQRYLPAETANYVPAFIAATYICNFFQMHHLEPDEQDLDLQLTSYLRIWEGLSFRSIADATGLEYSVVKTLNPGYKRDYVPAALDGNYVILPSRVMPAFAKYLNGISSQRSYAAEIASAYVNGSDTGDGRYAETLFHVDETEHVDRLGASLGVNGDQLKTWNRLENNWAYAGQTLKIWRPVIIQEHQTLNIVLPTPLPKTPKKSENLAAIPPKRKNEPEKSPLKAPPMDKSNIPQPKQFEWHTLRRNETLDDIAREHETTVETLRRLNSFDSLKIGMRLKVKEI